MIEGEQLRLIPSPCENSAAFFDSNTGGAGQQLLAYLTAYVRFDFPVKYEAASSLHRSIFSLCDGDITWIDLKETMRSSTVGALGTGHDGTHYSPSANQIIAHSIGSAIEHLGFLDSSLED